MSRKIKKFPFVAISLLLIVGFYGCSGKEETQVETNAPAEQQEETQAETNASSEQQEEAQTGTQPQADKADIEEPVKEEEEGFATSEEAVLSYLAGLRDNDFGRMEDSFLDKSRAADIINQYVYFCGFDQIPGIESEGYIKLDEDGDAEKFTEQLTGLIEAADFGSMEFLGFIPLDEYTDDSSIETYRDNLDRMAEENGGSELKNQAVVIRINDEAYFFFLDTIKADDRWYILQLGGGLPLLLGAEVEDVGTSRAEGISEEELKTIMGDNADIPKLPESRAGAGRDRIESEGFDTPEEAVTAYLEGLKARDTEQMLSTFSVESYAQNFNMQAYLEHTQAYMYLSQEMAFPTVNDFTKAMAACKRRGQLQEDILEQGNWLYSWNCFLTDTELEQGAFFTWEELQEKLELDSIEVIDFIQPETFAEDERMKQATKEFWSQRAGIYGADQIQDCVTVFTCGGEKYCLFMEVAQYDGRWYNHSFDPYTYMLTGYSADGMGTLPWAAFEEEQ